MSALVPIAVALPLLAAPALAAAGHWLPKQADDAVGVCVAVASVVLTALVLLHSFGSFEVYWFGGWRPRDGIAVGISFAVDPLGAGIAFLSSFLVLAAFVYGWRYFDEVGTLFHVLMLLFLGATIGFAYTADIFNLFVFLELMTTAAVALTGYRVEEEQALQGAFNFGVVNALGSILMLLGIGLLYGRTGALNLAQIGRSLEGTSPDGLVICAFVLLTVAFLVKAGAVPFHFWLGDAYAVAPATICVLFAGVMTEFGVFGFTRVYWTVFSGPFAAHADVVRDALLVLGVVTALVGATMSFLQRHLKRLLAYSSIAYTGVFLAGIATLSPDGLAGSSLYVVAHGLAKAALFLCAGILLERTGSVDELELRGRGRRYPLTAFVWAAATVALAGPPFLGTFLGHGLVGDAVEAAGRGWVAPLLALATAVSTAAILRSGARVFLGWGPARDPLLSPEPPEAAGKEETSRSARVLVITPAVLAGAALAVGALTTTVTHARQGAERFVAQEAYAARVLEGASRPLAPAASYATSRASIFWTLATIAAALALAGASLFRRHLPESFRAAVHRAVSPPIGVLRTVHSGHVGDYVAWLTFGTAVLGGLFALGLR